MDLGDKIALAAVIFGSILIGVVVAHAREATNETHATVSCASTSTEALAANQGRVSALFVNDSTSVIYLALNQTAVAGEGIRLNASGGSYYITDADGNLDREGVNCIVASGTADILATEWSN